MTLHHPLRVNTYNPPPTHPLAHHKLFSLSTSNHAQRTTTNPPPPLFFCPLTVRHQSTAHPLQPLFPYLPINIRFTHTLTNTFIVLSQRQHSQTAIYPPTHRLFLYLYSSSHLQTSHQPLNPSTSHPSSYCLYFPSTYTLALIYNPSLTYPHNTSIHSP